MQMLSSPFGIPLPFRKCSPVRSEQIRNVWKYSPVCWECVRDIRACPPVVVHTNSSVSEQNVINFSTLLDITIHIFCVRYRAVYIKIGFNFMIIFSIPTKKPVALFAKYIHIFWVPYFQLKQKQFRFNRTAITRVCFSVQLQTFRRIQIVFEFFYYTHSSVPRHISARSKQIMHKT